MKPLGQFLCTVIAMTLVSSFVPSVHAGPYCGGGGYRGGWGGGCYYRGGWGGYYGGWGAPVAIGAALPYPYYAYPYGYTYAAPVYTTVYPQVVEQRPAQVQHQPTAAPNALLMKAQTKLAGLGYYKGSPDGVFGPQTAGAVTQFQTDNNLPISGRLDLKTLASLGITP